MSLLHVELWAAVARQAPLSMGFSRQEYWSELPSPIPGDFPNPRIEPASLVSPALAGRFFTTETPRKPLLLFACWCSVAQLCPTTCDPMDYSMPGFPVLDHLPEFAQTHDHLVGDEPPNYPQKVFSG